MSLNYENDIADRAVIQLLSSLFFICWDSSYLYNFLNLNS